MSKPISEPTSEEIVEPVVSKMAASIINLYEKVSREYQLTIDEVKAATITIKDGEITIKVKGKK